MTRDAWSTGGIVLAGIVLLVCLGGVASIDPTRDVTLFLWLTVAAGAAYAGAVGLVARGYEGSSRLLVGCLLAAVIWRIPLVLAPPLLSTDVYRYVWDGRIQRLGYNPYVSAPADPSLQSLHTPLTLKTEHAELPTIYPPAAELFFRGVARVHESVLAFKVAQLLCDLIIMWLLLRWLQVVDRSRWWVLAYAWHPLVALEGAGSGHLDFLGVALMVGGWLAVTTSRHTVGAVLLALAVAVKFVPGVLAPLLLGRFGWRHIAVGALVLVGLYGWFAGYAGGLAVGSLGDYARRWRFNGPLFLAVEHAVGLRGALLAPVSAGLVVAGWLRVRGLHVSPASWAWPLGATLLFMPAIYPWYLLWLIPFLTVRATLPLGVWTLSVLLTYAVWFSERAGGGWVMPAWVMPVEYGAVLMAAAWVIWSGRNGTTVGERASTRDVGASA